VTTLDPSIWSSAAVTVEDGGPDLGSPAVMAR
jgi:hypothetical protein